MIAVSLNVGGGVRLIKPAKLCMCTQTLQTQRGRTHGAGCVRQWFRTAEPLGECLYENWNTHTHTHKSNVLTDSLTVLTVSAHAVRLADYMNELTVRFTDYMNALAVRLTDYMNARAVRLTDYMNVLTNRLTESEILNVFSLQ